MEPKIGYRKVDELSGVEILITIFGEGWVGITLTKEDERLTMMFPRKQWDELVKDMNSR